MELSNTWFHTVEGHCLPSDHLHEKICTHPERLVSEADMTIMRALYREVAEEFANEVPAWMF